MRRRVLKLLALIGSVCVLCLAGYFAGKRGEIPAVATWTVDEAKATWEGPTEREIERQIRALTGRDPEATAEVDYLAEDPCYYGVKTTDGWVVPGIPAHSLVITKGLWPVRMICWTGEAAKGGRFQELDRVAVEYAGKYNQRIDVILCTN